MESRRSGTPRGPRYLLTAVLIILAAGLAGFVLRWQTAREREAPPPRALMSDAEQLRHYHFGLIQPVALKNCDLKRFGDPHDGGYLLCANLLESVRSAYSYGIGGSDAWGCDVSKAAHIPVHQYDCFDVTEPVCSGGRPRFHPECVGTTTDVVQGHRFDTLARQIRRNGDRGKRIVVKMDVEGAEWDSLMLAPSDVLEQIDQLVVEFHGIGEERQINALVRLRDYFHVAHLHFNNFSCRPGLTPFPGWAYEVLFVSKRLGVVDEAGVPQLPHPADAPNAPQHADCQAGVWGR